MLSTTVLLAIAISETVLDPEFGTYRKDAFGLVAAAVPLLRVRRP